MSGFHPLSYLCELNISDTLISVPTVFIGLSMQKAAVPSWATWVMMAFFLFHLIVELLLEIHGCINSKKQRGKKVLLYLHFLFIYFSFKAEMFKNIYLLFFYL